VLLLRRAGGIVLATRTPVHLFGFATWSCSRSLFRPDPAGLDLASGAVERAVRSGARRDRPPRGWRWTAPQGTAPRSRSKVRPGPSQTDGRRLALCAIRDVTEHRRVQADIAAQRNHGSTSPSASRNRQPGSSRSRTTGNWWFRRAVSHGWSRPGVRRRPVSAVPSASTSMTANAFGGQRARDQGHAGRWPTSA